MAWKPDYVLLADLKAYKRITDNVDDVQLAVNISAASRAVDRHCNRQFGQLAGTAARLYTAYPDYERGRWIVNMDDLMDATGLVVTVGGVATTDFDKEPANAAADGRPWESLAFKASPSVLPTGDTNEISVTAKWGWSAVPIEVQQATLLQASRYAVRRDSSYGVAGSPDQGSELRLLARVDPDVAVALADLVRPRAMG